MEDSNNYEFSDSLCSSDNLLRDLDEIFGNPCEDALSSISDKLIDTSSNFSDFLEYNDSDYYSNIDANITNDSLLSTISSSPSNFMELSPVKKNTEGSIIDYTQSESRSYSENSAIKKQKLSNSSSKQLHINSGESTSFTANSSTSFLPSFDNCNSSNVQETQCIWVNPSAVLKCDKKPFQSVTKITKVPSSAQSLLRSSTSTKPSDRNQKAKILVSKSGQNQSSVNATKFAQSSHSSNDEYYGTNNAQKSQTQPIKFWIPKTMVKLNPAESISSVKRSTSMDCQNNCYFSDNKMKNAEIHLNSHSKSVQNCNSVTTKNVDKSLVLPEKCSQKLNINSVLVDKNSDNINNMSSVINCNDMKNIALSKDNMKLVDEQALKKKQRMIKNRESAKMSRMRKNQYVMSLETKVDELSNENILLKNENDELRGQLSYFSENCQCDSIKQSQLQHKQLTIETETRRNSTNLILRKNTAVLLAMVLMVSINISIYRFFLPRILENTDKFSQMNEKLSNDVNNDNKMFVNRFRRHLLWLNESYQNATLVNKNEDVYDANLSTTIKSENCPSLYVNQSENMRLVTEIRNWIEVNDYVNITSYDTDISFIGPKSKESFKYLNSRSKENINIHEERYSRRKSVNGNKKRREYSKPSLLPSTDDLNSMKTDHQHIKYMHVFNSVNHDHQYLKLFKKIHRKDDTFYVLSFNSDHILLPASAYNKTSRPKIALMFPATNEHLFNSNNNGKMTLMQIDCEIMNTIMLEFPNKNGNNERNENYNSTSKNRRIKANFFKTTEEYRNNNSSSKFNNSYRIITAKSPISTSSLQHQQHQAQHHQYNKSSVNGHHHLSENLNNREKSSIDEFFKRSSSSSKLLFKQPPFYFNKKILA